MRKMKDSGIEWIGMIPEGWEVCRLKNIVACHDELRKPISADKRENHLKLYDYYGASGVIDTIDDYNVDGTVLLIGEDGANLKLRNLPLIYRASGKFWVNNHAHILIVNKKYSYDYVAYLLEAGDYSNYITGSAQPKLSQFNLMRFPVAIPNYTEQENISFFIHRECSKIDSILSETRSSIEEYKKLKQAVITQAVTKGVRGKREMKDSGVEWIGEIPAEWSVQRIKTIFLIRNERNYLPLEQVNLISLYTDKDVVQHCDIEKTTGNKASNADGYKKVYPNDMIVNIILCWMGAIGRSNYAGVTSPAYDVYVPSSKIECKFYHYYFRTLGFSGDCYKNGRGIMAMRWRTYSDQFRSIKVVVPPLEEQKEIVGYLDAKCAEIDGLIAKKEQLVKELESYKKSLIYEVVTGKREV